jgi:hypothetical protein
MSHTVIQGKVSFVNHEKKYVMIEYEVNGKKKTINGSIDDAADKNSSKKKHIYHIGDVVDFVAGLSGRGDKMVATNIEYRYNTALDVLINKAKTENSFIGYLKAADDKIFVKEIDSYLFFPVAHSPWRITPTEQELNEAVTFSLENLEKKEKITAKLFNNHYLPEFYTAVKYHKSKTPIEAEVVKVTPHGIYLNVIGDKIQAKIPAEKNSIAADQKLQPGDKLMVLISYLSTAKIIVEPVL